MERNQTSMSDKIFVHIHKCAGTSMWKTLQKYPRFICCIARPGKFVHGISREYIPNEVWNSAFKFTFVRNPYARVVSAFKMFQGPRWKSVFPDFESFVEFLRWVDVDGHKVEKEISIINYVQRLDNIIHHCSSFHNTKCRLEELNFIGKLENLHKDMQRIAKEFEVSSIQLPQLNSTAPDNYAKYYNTYTKQIITQKYAADIERFGYIF